MDFLKEILGEELFKQVSDVINNYNGNEANKDKQIKLANLSGGEYVSKAKHDDLLTQLTGKKTELQTANDLIAELKKNTKGDEGIQQKVTDFETQIATLQQQNAQLRLDNALKVALLEAKATDIDYMTYKLKEKGDKLTLDENEKIKGIDELITGLKTQYPSQFEVSNHNNVVVNKLKKYNDDNDTFIVF